MKFKTNENGGWIVPADTKIEPDTLIPSHSEIGKGCVLGEGCEFGNWCVFGNGCEFGNWCEFGTWCEFGNWCKLGNGCVFGSGCVFGNGCAFGDRCKLGNGCKFGPHTKLDPTCTVEGIKARRWATLANLDGSGLQILVVSDGTQIKVRVGCFLGTVDEFCERAKEENKTTYVSVVQALVKDWAQKEQADA